MSERRRAGTPRPITDEELQLKKRARRRLVGAIVLVSAVAVLLPMVLDSEPRPANPNIDIQIPSPDARDNKAGTAASPQAPAKPTEDSKAANASPGDAASNSAPAATPETNPESAAKADATSTATAPTSPSPPAAEEPPTKRSATKESAGAPETKPRLAENAKSDPKASPPREGKAAHAETPAPSKGAYVVQVAALADAAKVKQLQKQMTGAGVKSYTEVVSTKSGEVTRVRAGPYASREAAEKARAQLKKLGLDGKVVAK